MASCTCHAERHSFSHDELSGSSARAKRFSDNELNAEAARLHAKMHALGYGLNECRLFSPYTLAINRLKKEKNAVVIAHNYQRPEILFGIADFVGDSLAMAREGMKSDAKIIVLCGVHFMAETAKILNPEKKVLLPALDAGCSLAESITAEDVRELKAWHPKAAVVTYVNTSAAVKAESDVCCTSANALKIVESLPNHEIIFLPDEFMGKNLAARTGKRIILWNGRCIVHEAFDAETLRTYKRTYPEMKVLAHLECNPNVVAEAHYTGGTSGMQQFVETSSAKQFMLVTECGMSDLLRVQNPGKSFVTPCSVCPHMKRINLENVLRVLEKGENEVTLDEPTRLRAKKALDKMLELGG